MPDTEKNPYFDEGLQRWIKGYAARNYWRVAAWYDLDDLIQDGYLCYLKCRNRYTDLTDVAEPTQDQRKHFMALVKTAFTNHIHDLARNKRDQAESVVSQFLPEGISSDDFFERYGNTDLGGRSLEFMLRDAPMEVRALVGLFAQDIGESVPYSRKRRVRETTNEHYCRRLGLDPATVDVVRLTHSHFSRI